jgi:hypothetical protein
MNLQTKRWLWRRAPDQYGNTKVRFRSKANKWMHMQVRLGVGPNLLFSFKSLHVLYRLILWTWKGNASFSTHILDFLMILVCILRNGSSIIIPSGHPCTLPIVTLSLNEKKFCNIGMICLEEHMPACDQRTCCKWTIYAKENHRALKKERKFKQSKVALGTGDLSLLMLRWQMNSHTKNK